MASYVRNTRCSCARCRSQGLTIAVFLITLGVLFLLDQNGLVDIGKSWPVLCLVLGGMIFFCRTASKEDHIEPYRAPAVPMSAAPPAAWNPPPPPPPPVSSAQPNPEVKP